VPCVAFIQGGWGMLACGGVNADSLKRKAVMVQCKKHEGYSAWRDVGYEYCEENLIYLT
jgi:hypothetical protein